MTPFRVRIIPPWEWPSIHGGSRGLLLCARVVAEGRRSRFRSCFRKPSRKPFQEGLSGTECDRGQLRPGGPRAFPRCLGEPFVAEATSRDLLDSGHLPGGHGPAAHVPRHLPRAAARPVRAGRSVVPGPRPRRVPARSRVRAPLRTLPGKPRRGTCGPRRDRRRGSRVDRGLPRGCSAASLLLRRGWSSRCRVAGRPPRNCRPTGRVPLSRGPIRPTHPAR